MVVGEFTDLRSVKKVARITNEVPDDEIEEFIDGVNQEILKEHGYPVERAWTYVDDERGSYFVNRFRQPVYKIDRVFVNGSLLPDSMWTENATEGCVSVGSGVSTGADGSIIAFDVIPSVYNRLATFMAAKDIVESQYLVSAEGGEFPRTGWLTTKIKGILNTLPNNPMMRSTEYASWSPETGTYVDQSGMGEDVS